MHDSWRDDDTEPLWMQHWRDLEAAWDRQGQRDDRSLRLINVSLVGFNLGMALLAYSHYLDAQGWLYLLGSGIHLSAGLYALWHLRGPQRG